MLRHCLKERHFKRKTYIEWQEVKEALGYETITDMLYVMYMDLGLSTMEIAEVTGFSQPTILKKLKLIKGILLRHKGQPGRKAK